MHALPQLQAPTLPAPRGISLKLTDMRRAAVYSSRAFSQLSIGTQMLRQGVCNGICRSNRQSSSELTVSSNHPEAANITIPPKRRRHVVSAAGATTLYPPSSGNATRQYQHEQQPVIVLHQAAPLGRVELIVGPMFAGKTTTLIRHARLAQEAGHRVLVIKSDKDKRYAVSSVATHDGDLLPCMAVGQLLHIHHTELEQVDVIAIDEAQFFPDLVEFVKLASDKLRKKVFVAGLDGDFRRQRFGQMLDLVPLADCVHKLHSKCFMAGCRQPAIFSMRITKQTEQEVVGGADTYAATCRTHYIQPSE